MSKTFAAMFDPALNNPFVAVQNILIFYYMFVCVYVGVSVLVCIGVYVSDNNNNL